ncbi:hypothetical protein DFH09DRAFT_1069841 [Mycena vulgaris]|nr:hypothetical protein DFH09DRAFT_1069841 [Mycena vulgaris]
MSAPNPHPNRQFLRLTPKQVAILYPNPRPNRQFCRPTPKKGILQGTPNQVTMRPTPNRVTVRPTPNRVAIRSTPNQGSDPHQGLYPLHQPNPILGETLQTPAFLEAHLLIKWKPAPTSVIDLYTKRQHNQQLLVEDCRPDRKH